MSVETRRLKELGFVKRMPFYFTINNKYGVFRKKYHDETVEWHFVSYPNGVNTCDFDTIAITSTFDEIIAIVKEQLKKHIVK